MRFERIYSKIGVKRKLLFSEMNSEMSNGGGMINFTTCYPNCKIQKNFSKDV